MQPMREWLVVAAILGSLLGGRAGGEIAAAQTGAPSGPQTLQVLEKNIAALQVG